MGMFQNWCKTILYPGVLNLEEVLVHEFTDLLGTGAVSPSILPIEKRDG